MIRYGRRRDVRIVLMAAVAALASCNTRTPIHENPVFVTAPTGWANVTGPGAPGAELAMIDVSPTITIGGGGGRGTVYLDGPAPDGGVVVSLASADSATMRVTPSVTVPAGGFSADFSYTTMNPTRDTDISIIASTSARSRSARVSVWAAVLPSFFFRLNSSQNPPGASRVTSDMNATFSAACVGNVVHATAFLGFSSGVDFAAAGLQPLRPGVYENATSNGAGHHLRLGSCNGVGRFEVREIEMYANGDVTNLWVTFETSCISQPGTTRGEFRGTNMRRTNNRYGCIGGK